MRSDYKINEILKLEKLNSEMLNCQEINKLHIIFKNIRQLLKKTMLINNLLQSLFDNYHSQLIKITNNSKKYIIH
jgi:Mg2+ and Co2+ transporter CorA